MTFAFRGTATDEGWRSWQGSNVAVEAGGITIAPAPEPAYVSPDRLPPEFEPVDVAVDDCGDLYLLASSGDLYRYDPVREAVDALSCAWRRETAGPATAIAVTRRSVYVAGAAGHLQAYARRSLQTRWVLTDPFESPVGLERSGDGVLLLDGGADGTGSIATVGHRADVERVVRGIEDPVDIAAEGKTTVVLAERDGSRVVERYDAAFDEVGAETVPDDVDATCLEAEADGNVLLGVGPSTAGEPGLFRLESGAVRRLDGLSAVASALALSIRGARGRPPGLYVVASEPGEPGRVHFLERTTRRRVNPTTDRYDAQAVTRIDSGEVGTEWHRVTTELTVGDTGSQVRLRYLATDDADLRYSDESVALEAVDGIGPTYADRLRAAGIRGLSELIEQSPERVSRATSTEVLDVSESRVADWMDDGRSLLAAADGPVDLREIDGIGPTFAGRLRDAGVGDVAALVDRSAAAVARIVSAGIYDVSRSRAEAWIENARALLAERDDVRGQEWTELERPNPRDALLSDAEGRYLWVELELVGDASTTPRVDGFRAYFPRQSYLRHLPAIYREDSASEAFLERYLSIFESVLVDIEEEVDSITRYLDPAGVPPGALSWLADWLAVESGPAWPESARRELLQRAPTLFKKRGTREGLLAVIRLYLRHAATESGTGEDGAGNDRPGDDRSGPGPIFLFEPSDLDCIDTSEVRAVYERLLPCPQCFIVLTRSRFDEDVVQTVDRIVDREQPAHTVGRAVQLRPWIELGGHSYLGVNSRLPDREFTVEDASLGKDSTLGSHEDDGRLGIRARIGTDTTIS